MDALAPGRSFPPSQPDFSNSEQSAGAGVVANSGGFSAACCVLAGAFVEFVASTGCHFKPPLSAHWGGGVKISFN